MKKQIKKLLVCFIATLSIFLSQSSSSKAFTLTLPIPTTPSISIPTAPTLPFPSPVYLPSSRFSGNPGDINITNDGKYETHIGEDGKADAERHHTDHGNPKHHKNPHDHKINWVNDEPRFSKSNTKLFSGNPFMPGTGPC